MKLTKMTASTLVHPTKTIIDAAYHLLKGIELNYVLQAVFADKVLEKFFGQTPQRIWGNFYIDIGDVAVGHKNFILHNLLKK